MPEPAWNHTHTHTQISSTLPPEVITCLENARFLHLSTCSNNTPHISLMNYTYLPQTPFSSFPGPTIIMTTPSASKKTSNLTHNPQVSLLVHDWVSHRPPTLSSSPPAARSPDGGAYFGVRRGSAGAAAAAGGGGGGGGTSLASLLLGMNTAALSRISTTINGTAALVEQGTEEESWFKAQHRANNTFEGEPGAAGSGGGGGSSSIGMGLFGGSVREDEDDEVGDGGAGCYIDGEEVRVVVVRIRDGRIADWKGGVRDWVVRTGEEGGGASVNGV